MSNEKKDIDWITSGQSKCDNINLIMLLKILNIMKCQKTCNSKRLLIRKNYNSVITNSFITNTRLLHFYYTFLKLNPNNDFIFDQNFVICALKCFARGERNYGLLLFFPAQVYFSSLDEDHRNV